MLVQKDVPTKFRIHKANAGEGNYDLSGATFSVTPVDAEGEPLITEATDAAGDVDLSNLALAVDTDYTIAETKAPDGFKLDADAVTVHIDADGTVALSGEAPASYTLDAADDGAFVLTCSDEPYVLQLLKTGPEGSMLPDASFDVTGQFAGGSKSESVQTDAQGTAKLASLLIPGQTYTLAETAAGGLSAACRLRAVHDGRGRQAAGSRRCRREREGRRRGHRACRHRSARRRKRHGTHGRRAADRRCRGVALGCGARAVRAPGQPAQRRSVGAHMVL